MPRNIIRPAIRPGIRPGIRPVIIDTDPGIDDAVAILLALASPELAVLGLVAVAGNLPLGATARNALGILELAGRPEIAVHAGCPRPIGQARVDAGHAHGESGLGDLVLPPPSLAPRPEHGVFYLIDTLLRATPRSITLCALGPLTDIAMALVAAPDITAGIAELVIMGGASHGLGNATPAAEFNIYADPHAAALVFDSGVPITMVPLDVTRGVRSTPERIAPIRAMATRCGAAIAELLGPRRALGRPAMAMHDPCVIAYLLAPELFGWREVNVAIDTQSPLATGLTLIDWRGVSGRKPNARVIEAADADGIYRLLAERFARLP
jgi:purine nucleosidase